jgi:hypothetical protein
MPARVQDLFTITDPDTGLQFTDALYFELDEYPPADLEQQKQARFDAWKAILDATPVEE